GTERVHLMLEPGNDLLAAAAAFGSTLGNFSAHAPGARRATTAHRSVDFDHLALERHDPVPNRAVGNSGRLFEVLGDQCVAECVEKRGTNAFVVHPDQVEEARHVLRKTLSVPPLDSEL